MKKTITILLAVLFTANVFAQAPNWQWAKSAVGSSNDNSASVTTDVSGNVLMTGFFSSTTITFGTTILTNAGSGNMFIVKYDASGNVIWAKSAGGTGDDRAFGVATDANGNVLITGAFTSPTITFGTTTLTNANGFEMFIVKYDANGNVLWAKSAGGTSSDQCKSVSVDAAGNAIIIGFFQSSAITFGTTTLTNTGVSSTFIVKYDAAGSVLWAKYAGGSSVGFGNSGSVDASGNILVTGYFSSPTMTFGTTIITNSDITGNTADLFIVKYDAAVNVLLAKSA